MCTVGGRREFLKKHELPVFLTGATPTFHEKIATEMKLYRRMDGRTYRPLYPLHHMLGGQKYKKPLGPAGIVITEGNYTVVRRGRGWKIKASVCAQHPGGF